MLHPTLGRWFEQDPIGFDAGDANWYRAAENNPANTLDPSGLAGDKATVKVLPSKLERLVVNVGNFQLPEIQAKLDVHTKLLIKWQTYYGVGVGRTPASSGQYLVWFSGRDCFKTPLAVEIPIGENDWSRSQSWHEEHHAF